MKKKNWENAISSTSARRIYDWIGKRYDWFGGFDSHAKKRSIELLDLAPGAHILEIGIGTGNFISQINSLIEPGGIPFGIDLSWVMLILSRQKSVSYLSQADARYIPFTDNCFDRVFISYVLDLIAITDIPDILLEILRVLKPGGRLVIVALTEGIDTPSRMLVSVWNAVYSVNPSICAGCRPLQLSSIVEKAGFSHIRREVVVQMAVPSEILVATK